MWDTFVFTLKCLIVLPLLWIFDRKAEQADQTMAEGDINEEQT